MRVQSFGGERRRLCEASVVAVFAVVIAGLPASAAEQYSQGLVGAAGKLPSIEEWAKEPVKYVGDEQTDKRFYDGALRHVVGVHRYEAFRANRTNPSEPGMIGWTYNHQPYLAYWNGKFYLQYLSDVKQEHEPPGRTLLMTSKDGRKWTNPVVVFPKYVLRKSRSANTAAICMLRRGHFRLCIKGWDFTLRRTAGF